MNLTVLGYFNNLDKRLKPAYLLEEGETFLLTAKITTGATVSRVYAGMRPGSSGPRGNLYVEDSRKYGLYFLDVILKCKPMWRYTYLGMKKARANWAEMDIKQELLRPKTDGGVVDNQLFYKSAKSDTVKNLVVLSE